MSEPPHIPVIPGAPAVQSSPPAIQPSASTYKPKPTWLVLAVAGGIFAVLAAVLTVLLPDRTPEEPPGMPIGSEVRISECQRTDAGNASALITVTNYSDRTRDYQVDVAFIAPGGTRVATATAYLRNVQPNQTASDRVVGMGQGASDCRLTDARRS